MKSKRGSDLIKVVAFAAIILCAVITLQWYQLQCLAHINEDVYVVDSKEVSQNLAKGGESIGDVALLPVKAFEPVYKRGHDIYVGEGKDKIEKDFPFYANNGDALMTVATQVRLYDSYFNVSESYMGMFISDGTIYNYDKTQADDETYLFAGLDNGLFVNTKVLSFKYPGGELKVKPNSLMNLSEQAVHIYSYKNGALIYSELPSTAHVTVAIGDLNLSYEQLLVHLGAVSENGEGVPIRPEEAIRPNKDSDGHKGSNSDGGTGEIGDTEDGEETDGEGDDGKGGSGSEGSSSETLTEDSEGIKGDGSGTNGGSDEGEKSEVPGADGSNNEKGEKDEDAEGNSGSNKKEDDGDEDYDDESSEEGKGDGDADSEGDDSMNDDSGPSDSEEGEKVPGGDDQGGGLPDENPLPPLPGGGEYVPPPFVEPSLGLSPFTADVYSIDSALRVFDPSFVLKKAVIELYWQPEDADGNSAPDSSNPKDYKLMYRKTFRSDGYVHIDNMPPDTTIYARGIMYYRKDGRTEEKVFYEGFNERVRTKGLDTIDDIYFTFESSQPDCIYLPYQIQIFNMTLSGPNANVLDKIRSIEIDLTSDEGRDYELNIGVSQARRNHMYVENPEDRETWTSDTKQLLLPPDSNFDYKIILRDPFGHKFIRVVDGYMPNTIDKDTQTSLNYNNKIYGDDLSAYAVPQGSTRTAKLVPTVNINQRKFDDNKKNIDRIAYNISVNDKNGAAQGLHDSYVLKIFRDEDKTTPVEFEDVNGNKMTEMPIKETSFNSEGDRYEIYGLTAGHVYEAAVIGSYNLNDNSGEYKNIKVGTHRFATISMANYGRVAYNLETNHITVGEDKYESATSQKISLTVNTAQTHRELMDIYFHHLKLTLTDLEARKDIMEGIVTRETMENIVIEGTDTGKKLVFELTPEQKALFFSDVNSKLDNGYLPNVSIETADFPGTKTLWDLFSGLGDYATLHLTWEDSLKSVTQYQLMAESFAMQGGEIHDVTSRSNMFRRIRFTTLKKMPVLKYDDILLVSDYIEIINPYILDEDKAIYKGEVVSALENVDMKEHDMVYVNDRWILADGDRFKFSNLEIGGKYNFIVYPRQIRRKDNSYEYVFRDEILFKDTFIAGSGINGRLVFEKIAHPLEPRPGEDEDISNMIEDFVPYNGVGCRTGWLSYDGKKDKFVLNDPTSSGWMTSPFIDVKPGEIYYLDGTRPEDDNHVHIGFADQDGNPVRVNNRGSGSYVTMNSVLNRTAVLIPEGVYKIFFNIAGAENGIHYAYAKTTFVNLTKAGGARLTGIKGTEKFPVKEGYIYAPVNYRDCIDAIHFFDKDGDEIEDLKIISPNGTEFTIGYSVKAPENVGYIQYEFATPSYIPNVEICEIDPAILEWLNTKDISKFANSFRLNVTDGKNNLIMNNDNKIYLEVYKNGRLLKGDENPLKIYEPELYLPKNEEGTETGSLSKFMSFNGESNQEYKINLYVMYRGKRLDLDSIEFKTNKVTEIIHNPDEFRAKTMRNPTGDFKVVEDLYFDDNVRGYTGNEVAPFLGHIDFDGHKLVVTVTGSYRFMPYIGSSALIENMEFEFHSKDEGVYLFYPFTYDSYGSYKNIVVRGDFGSGKRPYTYSGGFMRINYGTMENCAFYYDKTSSNIFQDHSASLAYSNYGTMKNCVVYSPDVVNISTGVYGGTESIDTAYNALLCGTNNGIIKNSLVIGSLAVENAKREMIDYNGLISATKGISENNISVGELLETKWVDGVRKAEICTEVGPMYGQTVNANSVDVSNNHYFSSSGYARKYDVEGRQELEEDYGLLRSKNFYDDTINKDGGFIVDDAKYGFYPRINMPECMMRHQLKIPLPSAGIDNSIKLLSYEIEEQHDDYAIVKLYFNNRMERKISDIKFEGLKVSPAAEGSTYEQFTEDLNYVVRVKVEPDGLYQGKYKAQSFKYEGNNLPVEIKDQYIKTEFYKEITMSNFAEAVNNATTYYRLKEDIDLSQFDASIVKNAFNKLGGYTGIFDGNGFALRNIDLDRGYLIESLETGKIKNLRLENVKLNGKKNSYSGIIGRAIKSSEISDVVVKNLEINDVYQYCGGIAGFVDNAFIKDCVVSGFKLNSYEGSDVMSIGGIVGYGESGDLVNSFAKNIKFDVSKGFSVNGIGGLVGRSGGVYKITNAYAQGSINSAFSVVGGIIGRAKNTNVENVWAKVSLSGSGDRFGGIAGYLQESAYTNNTLALGDIFTTSQGLIGRIQGSYDGTRSRSRNGYAFDLQTINSKVVEDLYDADGLLTEAQLAQERYYWNTCNLGPAFDYSHVHEMKLPKLYSTSGQLLPEQEFGISFKSTRVPFNVSGTAVYSERNDQGNKVGSYDFTVKTTFAIPGLTKDNFDQLYPQYFGERYENIQIEGMDMMPDGYPPTPEHYFGEADANGITPVTLIFTEMKPVIYADSYRVVYTFEENSQAEKLEFVDEKGNYTPIFRHIYRVKRPDGSTENDPHAWQDVMFEVGFDYENIMVMNDLDFSVVPENEFIKGLKLNRLVGAKAHRILTKDDNREAYLMADLSLEQNPYVTLSNVSYTETNIDGAAWFYEIRGELSYLKFKNLNLINNRGGDGFSVVKNMTGIMQYIDIDKLNIDYGKSGGYIGFIPINIGEISYVRLRDVNVYSSKDRFANYVGGLCGDTKRQLEFIGAKGTKNEDGDYSYNVSGRMTIGGIAGDASDATGALFCYADTVNIYATYANVGGVLGSGVSSSNTALRSCYSVKPEEENMPINIYCKNSKIICDGQTAGGIAGVYVYLKYGYSYNNYIQAKTSAGGAFGSCEGQYVLSENCTVVAGVNAGGVVGSPSYGIYNSKSLGNTVIADKNAGGFSATGKAYGTKLVDSCAVYAKENAGGAFGYMDSKAGNYVEMFVTNTKVGGTQTQRPAVVVEQGPDGKNIYKTVWVENPERQGTTNAGGVIGSSSGIEIWNSYVDDSVEVKAHTAAGGVVGRMNGGKIFFVFTGADVEAFDTAGGVVGVLRGYVTGEIVYEEPIAACQYVCTTSNVKAVQHAGAYAGMFLPGARPIDPETGDIIPDEESGYTEHMSRNNFTNVILANEKVEATGNGRAELIANGVVQNVKDGINYLRVYDRTQLVNNTSAIINLEPLKMFEPNTDYSAPKKISYEDLVDVKFYINGEENGGIDFTRGWRENPPKFYINTSTLSQNKLPLMRSYHDRSKILLWDYQDGILIPHAGAVSLDLNGIESTLDKVAIYSTGADTFNVEMPFEVIDTVNALKEMNSAMYSFTMEIFDENGNSVDKREITERSYTIPYDYSSTVTVKLNFAGEERGFVVSPDLIKNTVMTYGDNCYYIKKDGVYDKSGLAVSGKFLNLGSGKAVKADGSVVNLSTGETEYTLTDEILYKPLAEAVPAFTTDFNGVQVDAYKNYSVSHKDGGLTESDFRLIAKNGKLFGFDPDYNKSYPFQDFIADYYPKAESKTEYLTVLTDNHTLKDMKTPIKWPVDEHKNPVIKNYQIKEVSHNINGSQPYLVLRYYDNTAAAFNYMTGTLLFNDDSEKQPLSFGDFTGMWISSMRPGKVMLGAYNSAANMVNGLSKNPIDDSLLTGVYKENGSAVDTNADVNANNDSATDGKTEGDEGTKEGTAVDGENIETDAEKSEKVESKPENEAEKQNSKDENDTAEGEDIEADSGFEDKDTENGELVNGTGSGEGSDEEETSAEKKPHKPVTDETEKAEKTEISDKNEAEKTEAKAYDEELLAATAEGYVTMITDEAGGYEVFKADELLSTKGKPEMSENRKIKVMESEGIAVGSFDLEGLELTEEQNRTGIVLVGVSVALVAALLLVLYFKKKKLGNK